MLSVFHKISQLKNSKILVWVVFIKNVVRLRMRVINEIIIMSGNDLEVYTSVPSRKILNFRAPLKAVSKVTVVRFSCFAEQKM